MKRFSLALGAALIGFILGAALDVQGQGDLSSQVLRLLTRNNYWTGLNTYGKAVGLKLERQVQAIAIPTDTFENRAGSLYFNGSLVAGGGGGAPTTSLYWVGASDAGIPNAKNLSGFTGLVLNTIGTPSVYAGTTCTAQFVRSLTASGAATCAAVNLAADVSGNLAISHFNSGTGATNTTFWRGDGTWASGTVGAHNLLSATHSDTLAASPPTRGDIIVANATPAWARRAIGAVGYVVQSDGTDTIFSNSGSGLINLNATNVSSGSLADARLSANIALLNRATQIFTGTNAGSATANSEYTWQVQNLSAGTGAGGGFLAGNDTNASLLHILAYATGYTPGTFLGSCGSNCTNMDAARGALLAATDAGGLNLATTAASTLIRFYTHGTAAQQRGAVTIGDYGMAVLGTASSTANGEYGPINGPVNGSFYVNGRAGFGCGMNDAAGFNLLNRSFTCIQSATPTAEPRALEVWLGNGGADPGKTMIGLYVDGTDSTNAANSNINIYSLLAGSGTANIGLQVVMNSGAAGDIGVLINDAAAVPHYGLRIQDTTHTRMLFAVDQGGALFTNVGSGAGGDVMWLTAAPAISSGFGTSPSIAGNSSAFTVTIGTGPGTSGVVAFGASFTNVPACVVNDNTNFVTIHAVPTTAQVALATTGTNWSAADKVSVVCMGY